MIEFRRQPARIQDAQLGHIYDRWVTPEGEVKAEFSRTPTGYMIRFADEADFEISLDPRRVSGWPTPDIEGHHFESLFHHAIVPLLGNHEGGLFLHGSAVAIGNRSVAFLGLSRTGKTTLAGAMARAGYPLLTEDVIELKPAGDTYLLQPQRSQLRLFADSAAHLLGDAFRADDSDQKHTITGGDGLPFCQDARPLARLYLLGNDHSAALAITRLSIPRALTQILPHSFVLDVDDKPRLRGHFGRLAELAEKIPCHALDYPRQYQELPRVVEAIVADVQRNQDVQ